MTLLKLASGNIAINVLAGYLQNALDMLGHIFVSYHRLFGISVERASDRDVITSVLCTRIVFNEFLTKCEFGWYLKEGG